MNPQSPFGEPAPDFNQAPAPAPVAAPVFGSRPSRVWLVVAIIAIVVAVGAIGAFIWAFMNYTSAKTDVDGQVTTAVMAAVKDQADKDAAEFEAKEKLPSRQFIGPDDYGQLAFSYPKTWSVYVAKDATSGDTYEAYLNPGSVPAVSSSQQYALRILIEAKDYDRVISGYSTAVSRGDLTSSSVKVNGENGTRLDGAFSKDIRGSAVIFKIRDKTVTLRTDADTFRGDFDAVISSVVFNK